MYSFYAHNLFFPVPSLMGYNYYVVGAFYELPLRQRHAVWSPG